jgi:hypothetical protein
VVFSAKNDSKEFALQAFCLHAMPGFQDVNIDIDLVGHRVAWWQVFIFDQHSATRAIELDQPAIVGIESKTIFFVVRHGRMDFLHVPFRQQATFLVVIARVKYLGITPVATPFLIDKINIQVLGYADFHDFISCSTMHF